MKFSAVILALAGIASGHKLNWANVPIARGEG